MRAIGIASGVIINLIVLSWLMKIEKRCSCSDDWRRDYIKYFTIAGTGLVLVSAFMTKDMIRPFIKPVIAGASVWGLASIVNAGSILTYIPELKKRGCECALEDDWRDNFIFWWSLIGVVVMMFVLTGGLLRLTAR